MDIQKNNKNKQDAQTDIKKSEAYPEFIHTALDAYFEKRMKESWQGQHILHGKKPTIKSLIFSSNDYLHISQHPQLINAQIIAMQKSGNGQMQSGVFLSHHSSLFEECEHQFSQFLNYPATLLTQSGWSANMGIIQALAQAKTPVYMDFYTHMSFLAGVKTAGATALPFRHNSVNSLKKRLERYGPGIIAIDSIYSTMGTISPILEYVRLAKQYDCLLIVDESHSLGTHGSHGQGLVAELGLTQEVDVITASLAKAFSGRGGLIAGKKELIELIRYSSHPSIFSSTLLPHDLAGFTSSIKIISEETWRREQLHTNANYLREALLNEGFDLNDSSSQIIPIMAGTEASIINLRNHLEQEDIFGAVFCPPATPKNQTLIRLSISANHQISDLNRVIKCLVKLARQNPESPFLKK